MEISLKNKIALVTGGSKGIGRAIVQAFIESGASVVVFDLLPSKDEVVFHQVDVRNEEQIIEASRSLKKIDIVVNNAGVYAQASVEETEIIDLDKIIDTNLKGTYLITKRLLPLIRESNGCFINIASGLAFVPEPESPAYCASKAAIVMLTKCLAQRHAQEGIRVNAILPGPIDTDLLRDCLTSEADIELYAQANPMKKIGTPKDVANVAVFLASDCASYVTGGLYSVDGGESTSSIFSK